MVGGLLSDAQAGKLMKNWPNLGIWKRDTQDEVLTARELSLRFGPDRMSAGLALSIVDLADHMGTDPQWLAELICFESDGSFSPSVQNDTTRATGLVQFMPKTARSLGTTVQALSKMSALAQMRYVELYFAQFRPPFDSRQKLFMTVFYPAARFWPAGRPFPGKVLTSNHAATPGQYVANVRRFVWSVTQAQGAS